MNDRGLLEMAAKAAGLDAKWSEPYKCMVLNYQNSSMEMIGKEWDPLTDDGDALRLAVKIGMRIETPKYKGFGTSVETFHGAAGQTVFRDDPFEQTRRAIVYAAAEIGKAMP